MRASSAETNVDGSEILLVSSGTVVDAEVAKRIDELGALSGVAQHLRRAVTSVGELCGDQRIYVYKSDGEIRGLVKVGVKHLYYWRGDGSTVEVDPLCVLDFFVLDQRRGLGKTLFDAMLRRENKEAKQLAYDRPSPKLYPFLRKHYGLEHFLQQPNNFVIYDDFFFKNDEPPADSRTSTLKRR